MREREGTRKRENIEEGRKNKKNKRTPKRGLTAALILLQEQEYICDSRIFRSITSPL